MITKKIYLSLVVFISLGIFGSSIVEAMQPYGQPPMQLPMQPPMQPFGSQNPNAMHHQKEIKKLQKKAKKKPHKAGKYNQKIIEHQNKMAMGQ